MFGVQCSERLTVVKHGLLVVLQPERTGPDWSPDPGLVAASFVTSFTGIAERDPLSTRTVKSRAFVSQSDHSPLRQDLVQSTTGLTSVRQWPLPQQLFLNPFFSTSFVSLKLLHGESNA